MDFVTNSEVERKKESKAQSCPTLCDSMDYNPPDSVSMELSRREYWSGLPFPSPRHEVDGNNMTKIKRNSGNILT